MATGIAAAAAAVSPRGHGAVRVPSLAARCGIERWPVKTLTDRDAGSVRLVPVATSVRALRRVPTQHLTAARLPGVERHVYRVHARLVAAKAEADSDVHLILADPRTGGTMIAELPSASCTLGAPTALRARMAAARAAFDRTCGVASTHYVDLHGSATVTGVGFLDFAQGQRGVAPNAIELHPVLGFSANAC